MLSSTPLLHYQGKYSFSPPLSIISYKEKLFHLEPSASKFPLWGSPLLWLGTKWCSSMNWHSPENGAYSSCLRGNFQIFFLYMPHMSLDIKINKRYILLENNNQNKWFVFPMAICLSLSDRMLCTSFSTPLILGRYLNIKFFKELRNGVPVAY